MTQAANRLPAPVPEPKILGGGEHGFTFLVKEPSRFGIISGGVTAISARETKTPVGGNGFTCCPLCASTSYSTALTVIFI
jgi:hypothetical protein